LDRVFKMAELKPIVFSEEQRGILELERGRHLVLAPAGTGKTELLAHKVAGAMEAGVEIEKMACLTFTNRAARVMAERVAALREGPLPFIGNLHRFAYHFLLENALVPRNLSIYDEEDSLDTLGFLARSLEGEVSAWQLKTAAVSQKALGLGLELELLHRPVFPDEMSAELSAACVKYEALKDSLYAADFDDLLLYLLHALRNRESGWKMLDYAWLQVDEVQDMNALQWAIIEALAEEDGFQLFFGDHEQAIFSFMGARLDNLRRCAERSRVHYLRVNYRCPAPLLEVLNEYLEKNLVNSRPILSEASQGTGDGASQLEILEVEGTVREQDRVLADRIEEIQDNYDDGLTAVLVRTNDRADDLSEVLGRRGLSHFRISGYDLFRRKVIKNLLAWFTGMGNAADRMAWSRMLWLFTPSMTLLQARAIVTEMYSRGLYAEEVLNQNISEESLVSRFHRDFFSRRTLIFDTETTEAWEEGGADIIQIAAVICEGGEAVSRYAAYLKTDKPIGSAEAVHHISSGMLETAGRDRFEVLLEFAEIIQGAVLIAHNASFDMGMLKSNFQAAGIEFPETGPVYDSIEVSRHLFPGLRSYSLEKLIEHFKLEGSNSHNAVEDTEATYNLVRRMTEESAEILVGQLEFVQTNRRVIEGFRRNFGGLHAQVLERWEEQMSLSEAGRLFLRHLQGLGVSYMDPDDWFYTDRLFHHMDITTEPGRGEELFRSRIRPYLHYREADLILGDEQVILSTVHKAKGLEFERVIVPDCLENIYPNYRSREDPEALEEDARLLYVAISRSRRDLCLCYPTQRENRYGRSFPAEASRFLRAVKQKFRFRRVGAVSGGELEALD